jgi:hypothetical protein
MAWREEVSSFMARALIAGTAFALLIAAIVASKKTGGRNQN